MLKAVAAIYLPTPAQVPVRMVPSLADEEGASLLPPPGQSILMPGETFDPAAWGVDADEAAHLVATGAADLMPAEAAPQPDAPTARTAADASEVAA